MLRKSFEKPSNGEKETFRPVQSAVKFLTYPDIRGIRSAAHDRPDFYKGW